jgi:hypothetical protein
MSATQQMGVFQQPVRDFTAQAAISSFVFTHFYSIKTRSYQ